MSEYVIGDLHGCYTSLVKLLDTIGFDQRVDKLWLCGDLVARGDNSLDTLRLVKCLAQQGACQTVLGNHDITLIAVWRGIIKRKDKDKTAQILKAKDADELIDWLRHQPLLLLPNDTTVLVHAGIPPTWTLAMAQKNAKILERYLRADTDTLDTLLATLYDKSLDFGSFEGCFEGLPASITDKAKLKLISDSLTRMRLCKANGKLDFDFKGGADDPLPIGYKAWFDWQGLVERKILFGHWAALLGKVATDNVQSLDGGCVWGGRLLAYRLDDGAVLGVDCHR